MAKLQSSTYSENFFELFALFLVFFGFLAAKSAKSAAAAYTAVFIAGLLLGRVAWFAHDKSKVPFAVLTAAFLVGFMTGSVVGNPGWLFIILGIGMYSGHELHRKKYWIFTA